MKKYIAAVLLSVAAFSATAGTPTFAEVEQNMKVQNYTEARTQMDEILRKRPESKRAHALNAQLLLVEGAKPEVVAKAMSYSNRVVAAPPVAPQSNVARNIVMGLCGIAVIIACFLGWTYVKIRSRNKVKSWDAEGIPVIEIDRTNYSTQLTTHVLK